MLDLSQYQTFLILVISLVTTTVKQKRWEQVQQASSKQLTGPSQGERELFRFPLSSASSVRILVSGPTGPNEIEKLIRVLKLQKELWTDESGAEDDKDGK